MVATTLLEIVDAVQEIENQGETMTMMNECHRRCLHSIGCPNYPCFR